MADKPAPAKPQDPMEIIIVIFIIFALGGAGGVTLWVNQNQSGFISFWNVFYFDLINFFAKFAIFSSFFSAAAVILLAIYVHKFHKMRDQVIKKILPPEGAKSEVFADEDGHPKWKIVLENINSDDPNKWKFAILEADIILEDLLGEMQLPGDNIGDKLKAVDPADFNSIEEAWEAHKIRNAIAHEGSDFLLSQREAKRVVGLYEKVFREFGMI